MEFRIANTFTESLARLTGDEQKAVKTTAFDLQINPASPGMSLHKRGRRLEITGCDFKLGALAGRRPMRSRSVYSAYRHDANKGHRSL